MNTIQEDILSTKEALRDAYDNSHLYGYDAYIESLNDFLVVLYDLEAGIH